MLLGDGAMHLLLCLRSLCGCLCGCGRPRHWLGARQRRECLIEGLKVEGQRGKPEGGLSPAAAAAAAAAWRCEGEGVHPRAGVRVRKVARQAADAR